MTKKEWVKILREVLKDYIVQEDDQRFVGVPKPVGQILLATVTDITGKIIGYQSCSLEDFYEEFKDVLEDDSVEDKLDEMMRRHPEKGWNRYFEFWKSKGIRLKSPQT